MKKLLFLLTVILLSCSQPGSDRTFTSEDDTPIHPIVGIWERADRRFDFYSNGEFLYYEYPENIIINEGFYIIEEDTLYIQDYYTGSNQSFYWIIEEDVMTLRPFAAPENIIEWDRVSLSE